MDEGGDREIDLLSFAVRLRRMTGEFNRIAHEFAGAYGLHPTDVQALIAILDAPARSDQPMTPGRLREELNITSGAVTACLDRLERSGHIRRERDVNDRRVVHLHYLDAAREFAGAFFRPVGRATDDVLRQFGPADLRTVAAFLDAMNEELAALRSRPS